MHCITAPKVIKEENEEETEGDTPEEKKEK